MKKRVRKAGITVMIILLLLPFFMFINPLNAETDNPTYGIVTGTIFDIAIKNDNPNAQIEYYNSDTDLPLSLETGKIDGYVTDEPIAMMLCQSYSNHYISKKLSFDEYGIIVSKEKPELLEQLNEYLVSIKESGELYDIQKTWLSTNEENKTIDYESIRGNSPVITLATTVASPPFDYVKDDNYAGYEIALVVSFCKEYGYGLEINGTNFTGVLSSVSTNKADLGTGVIIITDERKETMNFTNPIYEGGGVLVKKKKSQSENIESLSDLTGKSIGIQAGSTYDRFIKEKISNPDILYYNFISDMSAALDSNKIQGFVVDKPVAEAFINEENGKYRMLEESLEKVSYGFAFPKVNENGEILCSEFNDFLKLSKINGLLDKIYDKWIGNDENKKTINKEGLTGEKGTITLAISSTVGVPFTYIKDEEIVGCDVEIVYEFAREYGYDIKVDDYSLSALYTAIPAGKCDIGAAGMCITDERKETMNFPMPYYESECVVVVKNIQENVDNVVISDGSFIGNIKESFVKTFIRENRYKLFIDGIITTIVITILSLLFGTLLGLFVYTIYRSTTDTGRSIIDGIINFIQKTPVVVILMILYYVIFGNTHISGNVVSTMGLTILFASSVTGLLKMGVGSIDNGQMEAAYTLGYTKNKAFVKIIMPQAVLNVLSGYKTSITSLIKDSAIVGYIAVQDLTKVSDIVRSRTYEAFFPLIVTAIIYYIIATVFIILVGRIELVINPKKRKSIPLLEGVKTK